MTFIKFLSARLINHLFLLATISSSIFLLSACLSSKEPEKTGSLILQGHSLVDQIWDTHTKQFISKDDMYSRLGESKYLLLGETHDNITHHQHQAEIIADLYRAQKKLSLHFEMIDDQQAAKIDKDGFSSVDELVKILSSTQAGWNYGKMYRPLFEQAINAGFQIFPANLDRKRIRAIFSEGDMHIPDDVKRILHEVSLTDEQTKSMEEEIIKGHCNVMPGEMLKPMLLTQQVRDARMSLSLLNGPGDIRLLITGSGHARKDRGVPLYLHLKDNTARIISIAMIEVEENQNTVDDYKDRWDADEFPFDFIWFTPRYDRPDPCEGLEQRMKTK